MAGSVGTIRGQMVLDVKKAIAGYVAVRAANAQTIYALRGAGTALKGVSKATGVAGLAIAAGFGLAIKAAADFERQLDFFGAVTDATQSQMEAVRKKALQLGQDTIYSAGQIADSFVELGKAGVSADLIISGVGDAVAHLGAAADIPLTQAAVIITAAVQSFSLSGKEAVHVADLLAGAANASIVEVEDLGVSLKYVGGVAAALGLPINDVIDSLALLGKYGIRGSTAGTSLRQILVSLTGTSKKATKQLKDLGIITKDGANLFFDAKGKAKPLAEIFQILQDKTKGLTQAQKVAAFKTIFNNRALAAALDLTKEGTKGFAAMNKEIGKTTAAEVSAKRLDNLSGDIEILRGNIETLLITAGTPMQNFLRGIVQGVTKVVQAFSNLSPSTQTLILKIIAVVGGLLLLTSAVTGVLSIVFRFADNIQRLGVAMKLAFNIMKAGAIAMRALSAAMLANPIGLVIVAIVALIAIFVILYKKNETFRNAVQAAGRAIVAAFKAVVAWFQGLPEFFSNLWSSVTGFFTNAYNTIVGGVQAVISWLAANWVQIAVILGGPLVWAIAAVIHFRDQIVGFFSALPGRVIAYVTAMVNGIVSWFQQLPARAGYAIGFMIGTVVRLMIQFYTQMFHLAAQIVTAVINWFIKLPGRVASFFASMYRRAVALAVAMRNGIISAVRAAYNGVISFFSQLPGRVAAFVTSMYRRAVALFQALVSYARSAASRVVSGVTSFISQLPGRVNNFVNSMVSRFRSGMGRMISAARELGGYVISAIMGFFRRLPGLVGQAISNAVAQIRGAIGRAASAARSFGHGIWQGFKDGMGIHSPSFIEKAMFALTDNVDGELKTLNRQVGKAQYLGKKLATVGSMPENKQNILAGYSSKAAQQLAQAKKLEASLQKASLSVDSAQQVQVDQRLIQASSGKLPDSPNVVVQVPETQPQPLIGTQNVYNPKEEPSSQTATRQADRTAALGGRR